MAKPQFDSLYIPHPKPASTRTQFGVRGRC